MKCPHCREDIKGGATRCPFCGGAIAYGDSPYERGSSLIPNYVVAFAVFSFIAWIYISNHGFMEWLSNFFNIGGFVIQFVFPIVAGLLPYFVGETKKG